MDYENNKSRNNDVRLKPDLQALTTDKVGVEKFSNNINLLNAA